jgi:hypothetical protein
MGEGSLMGTKGRALLGLGLIAAGIVALAFSGNLSVHETRFAVFYGLALAGFALLATAASGLPLRGAVLAAIVLRLVLLPGTPTLSDDFFRLLWDGRVQLGGTNPYLYAPGDAALDGVDYADREDVDFPAVRTPYPPLAQATFLGVAAAGGDWLALKLLFGLFDLATAAAVWWLAGIRRHTATVLYLLCPAVIVQTWDAAHLESVAVFFVVLAAALLVRRRDGAAGVALGVAAAFRLTPLALLVPALLGGRAKPARLLAGFLPTFLLPYVPYLATGGATGSLFEAGTGWAGQAFLFAPLARIAGADAARAICAAAVLAGAVWISRRVQGRERTAAAFAWTLSLIVLCLPVVHAWYWLTPLALALAAGIWLPVVAGTLAPIPEAFALTWPAWLPPWRQALAAPLLPPWRLSRAAPPPPPRTRTTMRGRSAVVRCRRAAHTGRARTSTEGWL